MSIFGIFVNSHMAAIICFYVCHLFYCTDLLVPCSVCVVCGCVYTYWGQSGFPQLPSILVFEVGSLTDPGAHRFRQTSWSTRFGDPPVSASSVEAWSDTPASYMCAKLLDYVFMLARQVLLLTEPTPQPHGVFPHYDSVSPLSDIVMRVAYSLCSGVFWLSGLFCFHINFKIFFYFYKKWLWDFDRDWMKSLR